MASEIRVNKIENRSGLGTVTFADTGVDLAGIVTATTFSGSGASLTNLPAANVTGTLPAISGANLTNLTAGNLTGALPAISGANLTGIAATDNVRTGILDVAGIATFRNDVNIGNANRLYLENDSENASSAIRNVGGSGSSTLVFTTGGTDRWQILNGGDLVPQANNSYDIGSSSYRVQNIYTNDLNLSNKGSSNDVDGTWGDYTIQEGESDLFLINNRTGKKYKFNLTEVS